MADRGHASEKTAAAALHDVAVVGGGLIGAAAALGAALQGLNVLLVDREPPAWEPGRLGMDIRNVAVSPASRALLERLRVWQESEAVAYAHMRVWEERGTRAMEFEAADVARQELGWILENGPLVSRLWRRLGSLDNVVLHTGDQLVGLEPEESFARLHLAPAAPAPAASPAAGSMQGSLTVRARLVIGADGARSSVRELLRVKADYFDTGHHALATVVRTERGHEGCAFQRFLLDGPLALLPGKDPRQSSVVWSQSPASAARRAGLDEAAFCREITTAAERCMGDIEAADRRLVFPLQQMLASSFNPSARILLIGDAARVLHPLAGLGANLGFEDVADLLGGLSRLPVGGDPGAPGLWQAFARRRHARARLMVNLMGGLRRVYASSDPLLLWLRNLGVGWLNAAMPVKRQIIREALGLGPMTRVPGR